MKHTYFIKHPNIDNIIKNLPKIDKSNEHKKGIYLINVKGIIYIGKTNASFKKRFNQHKREWNNLNNLVLENSQSDEQLLSTLSKYSLNKALYTRFLMAFQQGLNKMLIDMSDIEYYLLYQASDKDNSHTLRMKELSYINQYKSSLYGLNQLPLVEFLIANQGKILSYKEFLELSKLIIERDKLLEICYKNNYDKHIIFFDHFQYSEQLLLLEFANLENDEVKMLINMIKNIKTP